MLHFRHVEPFAQTKLGYRHRFVLEKGWFKDKLACRHRFVLGKGWFKDKLACRHRFVLGKGWFKEKLACKYRFVLGKGRFKDKLACRDRFVLGKGRFKDKASFSRTEAGTIKAPSAEYMHSADYRSNGQWAARPKGRPALPTVADKYIATHKTAGKCCVTTVYGT